jgi:hypothetical protein
MSRDVAPIVPAGVAAAINTLLAQDAVGGNWRTRDRALEVFDVPVFHVQLDTGREAWLVGSPARVIPATALGGATGLFGWIVDHVRRRPGGNK